MRPRIILIILALAVGGCGGTESDGRTRVVASFYPLAFAAESVAAGTADVVDLTPPGAEPHDLELTARDVGRIRSADVVLYLGEGFQPALEEAVEDADGEVVDLLDGVALREREGEAGFDPHVWLDPVRYAAMIGRVGRALGRAEQAEVLAASARRLDEDFRAGLADCERREVVTSHAAFGYLVDRYGLEQVAISGISPEVEPTPADLRAVVDDVERTRASTVFFETLVSPRLAETVAREVGADVAVLDPLEGLTDEERERGEDYFSVMRANLAALRKALACR